MTRKITIKQFALLIIYTQLIFVLHSCTSEKSLIGETFSLYGTGGSNTSSFERFPTLSPSSWSCDSISLSVSGCSSPILPLNDNTMVVATTDNKIVSFKFREVLWEYALNQQTVRTNMVLMPDGSILALTTKGTLINLTSNGKVVFSKQIFSHLKNGKRSIPATYSSVVSNGTLCVVSSSNGEAFGINHTGDVVWSYSTSRAVSPLAVIHESSDVYLTLPSNEPEGSDSLIAISHTGQRRWGLALDRTRVTSNILLSGTTILVGGQRELPTKSIPVVEAISESGQIIWSKEIHSTPRGISLSEDGVMYITSCNASIMGGGRSSIHALNCADGNITWEMYLDAVISSPAAISNESIGVVATQSQGAIGYYLFDKKTGSLHNLISLSNAPEFALHASVTPRGSIVFPCLRTLGYVSLDKGLMSTLW